MGNAAPAAPAATAAPAAPCPPPTKCETCDKPIKVSYKDFWNKLINIAQADPRTSETEKKITRRDIEEGLSGMSMLQNLQKYTKYKEEWSPICDRSEALDHAISYFKRSEAEDKSPRFIPNNFKKIIENNEGYQFLYKTADGDPMFILILIRSLLVQYLYDINSEDAKANIWNTFMRGTTIMQYIHTAANRLLEKDGRYTKYGSFSDKWSLAKSPLNDKLDNWWSDKDALPDGKSVDEQRFLSSAIMIGFIEFMITKPAQASGTGT